MPALTGLERVYQKELKKKLQSLNKSKWLIPFAWFYTGFYLVLLASAIFGIVIGLIPTVVIKNAEYSEEVRPYMYGAVFLGILGICIERIYTSHKHKIPLLRDSKFLPFLMAFVFSLVIYAGAWYLGSQYIGGQLNADLLSRIGIMIGIVLLLSIPYFGFNNYDEKFRNHYKSLAVGKTQSLLELSLEYNTQDRIASSTFAKSKLYPTEDFAHYNTSDKFVGRTEKLRFEFCQVDTWDHRKVGNRVKIMPLFKGVFFRISIKEHFDGQTVWPSEEVKKLREGQVTEVLNNSLGRTDISFSPVYIGETELYSTHPDEAKKYFTNELIGKVNKLKQQFNSDVSISLVDDSLFIAIPLPEDIFWPGTNANLDDYKKLEEHIDKVEQLISIAKIGDLILAEKDKT